MTNCHCCKPPVWARVRQDSGVVKLRANLMHPVWRVFFTRR